jgi:hypothetical protein
MTAPDRRHPIMVGFLIAVRAAPPMTAGHLLFAVAMTGHILIAVQLEERDLIARRGARSQRYREQVPAFVPLPSRTPGAAGEAPRAWSSSPEEELGMFPSWLTPAGRFLVARPPC